MQDTSLLDQIDKRLRNNGSKRRMRTAQYLFDMIISKIGSNKYKYIMFEKWFNIEDVEFKDVNYPPLPEEINEKTSNEELIKNTQKNITKIAYLNEYVYKNDELHNIILNDCIGTKSIPPIAGVEYYIKMTDNYIIKNAPPRVNNTGNQKVNIAGLDALTKNDFNYSGEWQKALKDAKEHFKDHLKFGREVESGLEEYINIINGEAQNLYGANQQKFNKWMEEGPNTLYENLKALDDFLTKSDLNPVPKNENERYHCCKRYEGKVCPEDEKKGYSCKGKCEFLEACGSNIRYFGVDCVDELWIHKNNELVEEDRTRMNSEGGESKYWIHLRPQRLKKDTPLGFLSLRIHFRPLGAGKIEIGWIGRHLYLP